MATRERTPKIPQELEHDEPTLHATVDRRTAARARGRTGRFVSMLLVGCALLAALAALAFSSASPTGVIVVGLGTFIGLLMFGAPAWLAGAQEEANEEVEKQDYSVDAIR